MTLEQTQEAISKISKSLKPCATCGATKREIISDMTALPVISQDGTGNFKTVQCVILVCSNCAHLEFFSAVALGIVQGDNRKAVA